MKSALVLIGVVLICSLSACGGPKSSRGFSLPDGDVATGQQTFLKFGCNDCHSVAGLDELRREGFEPVMTVPLGGETTHINTYGELVTSIINPSHRISRNQPSTSLEENGVSKMRNYNDELTVTEMINLVAFLQAQYQLQEYYQTRYPMMTY